jgi:hypothetical protein
MAVAGFKCSIRRGGIPTAVTAEACTTLSSTRFQVTSTARRCIDPTAPWNVKAGAATVAYSAITSFDFLFGEVTLASPTAGVALTLDGTFIPLTTASEFVTEVKGHSLSQSSDLMDTTVYTSTSPFRKRIYGLGDASISVDMLVNVADMPRLATLMSNGSNAIFEINSGSSPVFRGIGKIASIDRSSTVDGLVEATVEWVLNAERDSVSGFIAGYSERNI